MTVVVVLQNGAEPDPWEPPVGGGRRRSVVGSIGRVLTSRTRQLLAEVADLKARDS